MAPHSPEARALAARLEQVIAESSGVQRHLADAAHAARIATAKLRRQGLSIKAIAAITGRNPATVSDRLRRHRELVARGEEQDILGDTNPRAKGSGDATPGVHAKRALIEADERITELTARSRELARLRQELTADMIAADPPPDADAAEALARRVRHHAEAAKRAQQQVYKENAERDSLIRQMLDLGLPQRRVAALTGVPLPTVSHAAKEV